MAATDIVTLAEAKTHLNIDDSGSDAELGLFIDAATGVVEQYVGAVIHRTVVETFDGGLSSMALSTTPVVGITSVAEGGSALDAGAYAVSRGGLLSRVSGTVRWAFLAGVQSVQVTYTAGVAANTAAVPGHIRLAALIIVQHMWETQRPAGGGPFTQGIDDYDPRYSYSIPRRALELLGEPVGGIA